MRDQSWTFIAPSGSVCHLAIGSIEAPPDDRDAPNSVRVEAVIHGHPCNRYKQKSRRVLAFLRGASHLWSHQEGKWEKGACVFGCVYAEFGRA